MNTQVIELRAALGVVKDIIKGIEERLERIEPPRLYETWPEADVEDFCLISPEDRGIIHPECITPDVPEGWDTVLGYLAKHQPEVLECFDYTAPEATARDGWWLRNNYNGWRRYTEAPPVLREKGISKVRLWPVSLLQQRWG